MKVLLDVLIEQVKALATLPTRIDSTLAKINRGELLVTARAAPDLRKDIYKLTRTINRLVGAVVFAALLLAGSLLYVTGDRTLGGVGFGLALLSLIWVLRG